MDDVILLIQEHWSQDAIGQQISTETCREIFATVETLSRSEWFRASVDGLQRDYKLRTAAINYQGERLAQLHGQRYGIYRVYYPADSDDVELYLESKAGVRS